MTDYKIYPGNCNDNCPATEPHYHSLDYKERFRSKYAHENYRYFGELKDDILAFIEEQKRESRVQGYFDGNQKGRAEERKNLIEKIEGMRLTEEDIEPRGGFGLECADGWSSVCANLLTYLRSNEGAFSPKNPENTRNTEEIKRESESAALLRSREGIQKALDKVDLQVGGALIAMGGGFRKTPVKSFPTTECPVCELPLHNPPCHKGKEEIPENMKPHKKECCELWNGCSCVGCGHRAQFVKLDEQHRKIYENA